MKRTLILFLLFPIALMAQLPTTDAATQAALQQSNAQRMVEHGENINKWLESLEKAQAQLQKAQEGVKLLTDVKDVMGDPTKVVSLLSDKIGGPGAGEVGKTFSELGKTVGGVSDLAGDTKSLFSPINTASYEDLASGNIDFSTHDPLQKFNALENTFQNFGNELQRSEKEASALRSEIDTINKRTASTQAEQSQKQADLLAAQGKLADAKKRSDDAFQKLQATKTLMDAQKDKLGAQNQKLWEQGEKDKKAAFNKLEKMKFNK